MSERTPLDTIERALPDEIETRGGLHAELKLCVTADELRLYGPACYYSRVITAEKLRALCRRHDVGALYAFGSRAAEVAAFVQGQGPLDSTSRSDIDLGVLPRPGHRLDVDDRVRLTIELEDLLNVPRVDLVVLPQAAPYLALDVVSGELLFSADPIREAEYELYVLRRAGDLAFFERERRRTLLAGIAP